MALVLVYLLHPFTPTGVLKKFDEGVTFIFYFLNLALEYAVNVIKIRHLVVMGHGGCGGVAAALADKIDERCCEFVGPWVKYIDTHSVSSGYTSTWTRISTRNLQ